jgi:hypothetical protein
VEVFAKHAAKQAPELILGMRIILAGSERRIAGQAAEHEHPCIAG